MSLRDQANIVLIISDTFRRDHIGAYGNTWIKTPSLDRFASQSVIFDQHLIAGFPTVPTRADILSGTFSYTFIIRRLEEYRRRWRQNTNHRRNDCETLATPRISEPHVRRVVLADAGRCVAAPEGVEDSTGTPAFYECRAFWPKTCPRLFREIDRKAFACLRSCAGRTMTSCRLDLLVPFREVAQ